MSIKGRPWPLRYGCAILCVAIATVIRVRLDPMLGTRFPVITYFPALVFAAWFGGLGPSLLALLLSAVTARYYFLPPYGGLLSIEDPVSQVGFGIFLFVGLANSLMGGAMNVIQRRAESSAEDARTKQRQLEREVAERWKVEEKVREHREWLRVTLESIGDAVIATDLGGRITLLNSVARALTGWDSEDALGRPLGEVFRVIDEQSRTPAANPVDRAFREGKVIGPAQLLLVARDGSERPIDDSAAPIRDGAGRVVGVALVFRDVTERRRNEEALREADRRKDEFLAVLAHELRNPLAPIRNALHLMGDNSGDRREFESERAMAERQVIHLARLVDDLMDVSRISQGKIALRKEVVDVMAAVDRVVESSRSSIRDRGHALAVARPEVPIRLEADPTRLEQILDNILSNAVKYTEPGGQIRLSAAREGDEVVVRVRDSGIGIEPEMLPRIFEMFVQAGSDPGRSKGGMGIGLGLVRALVDLHGGSVIARSGGPGEGSTFEVRLPALPIVAEARDEPKPQPSPPAPAPAAAEPTLPRRRILVVDDNEDAARSLARLLSRLYRQEVRVAHSGIAALEAADEFHPEVVLLDIGMPGMDGYQVARQMRERPNPDALLLVAVTGWGQDEDRRKSREAGFDRHLVKPVDPEALRTLFMDFCDAS